MSTPLETSKAAQDNRAQSSRLMQALRPHGLQLGIIAVGLVIWLLFMVSSPRTWTAPDIYVALMTTVPFFALVAIPLTLVVITGEICGVEKPHTDAYFSSYTTSTGNPSRRRASPVCAGR